MSTTLCVVCARTPFDFAMRPKEGRGTMSQCCWARCRRYLPMSAAIPDPFGLLWIPEFAVSRF